ncbi:hypothetical protein [Planctomicrobium piriforme]|uniref:Uncharacterized protein n=1 Tax=Planctomicrobium piriforme TaxID=1576369 RepID=A0A1I3RL12_9PLAN|nr:hypothetical protein [Planctomicrobium piriforme]SFJ46542.1 hypothetical protein SAMN05421753_12125 [Planctomicrobium piriforme]
MAKVNFKKLALDHVEKAVFGVIALIALLALAGTQWKPYSGTPTQITEKIAKGRQTLQGNVWPEEEKAKYIISKEAAPANIVYERLRKEFSPAAIEPSGRMVVDIFGGSEPVREPELLAVQNPIASGGRVFLEVLGDVAAPAEEMTAPATGKPAAADESLPDEFRNRRNMAGPGMPGMDGPMMYSASPEMAMGGMPGMSGMPTDPGMSGMPGMTGMVAPQLNGQGYHFVSVRAVFPLRDQITKYAEAIHKSYHYAASVFDILDFELERQIAQPGKDPWTGSWEKVDLQAARDILDKAASFDADVVSSTITNAVITMPLPLRISGEWRKQATHPQIEKFELSDSEIATEAEMQRKLLQEAAAQRKQMDSAVSKRGGFAQMVVDTRQLNADMFGGSMYGSPISGPGFDMGMNPGMGPGMGMSAPGGPATRGPRNANAVNPIDKLVADMAKGSTNRAEEEKRIREWIQSRVSAEGELLLFRYLDFNVEPGKAYRYRVRLVLKNPNFGKRIADAGGVPHVVEGETRVTPWSPITTPVAVEEDMKYFITEVKEQSGRVLPVAKFDVFQWDPSHGTFMNNPLEVRMGQPIADEVETTVIDPAKSIYETQKYWFTTNDYLVDASPDIRLDDALHEKGDDGKTLKLPPGMRGKLPLAPQTLVARENQQLVYLSSDYQKQEHATQKSYIEMQGTQFEYLKAPKVPEGGDPLAGLGLGPSSPSMGPPSEMAGPRTRNTMRRGRGGPGPMGGMSSP